MDFLAKWRKVMRRTELNVAMAGAMIGSVAAMSKLFPVMERWSRLTVIFYGHEDMSWQQAPVGVVEPPWRDFLKWYHGRPQSDCYVMWARQSNRMFRRKDIRAYVIEYGERKKETIE